MDNPRIYLDYNASSLIRPESIESVNKVLNSYGNPSSIHKEGRSMRSLIEDSREKISNSLSTSSDNIIFTSGGTEAIDIALNQNPGRIIINSTEHIAVFESAKALNSDIDILDVDKDGLIRIDLLENLLKKGPALVSVMYANNETGVIQPIKQIAKIVKSFNSILFCDAVQAFGKVNISFNELGIDLMAISAHKIGGFSGSGALVVNKDFNGLIPKVSGGGQEFGLRGGTENLLGIISFGECASALKDIDNEGIRLKELIRLLEDNLSSLGANIFGYNVERLPNTSLFSFTEFKAESLLMKLDLAGFSVSSGSACSSGKVKERHVLKAMNISESMQKGAIRVSLGWGSNKEQVENLINFFENTFSRKTKE